MDNKEENTVAEPKEENTVEPSLTAAITYVGEQVGQFLQMAKGENHGITYVLIATKPEEDETVGAIVGNVETMTEAVEVMSKVIELSIKSD